MIQLAVEQARAVCREVPAGLLTDFDGTVSAIAPRPEDAFIDLSCRQALAGLAERLAVVAVLSGRAAADVRTLVDVPGVVYVGNHGMETWRHGEIVRPPDLAPYPRLLEHALVRLRARLPQPGLLFEPKGPTASIHYRLAPDHAAARSAILDAITAEGLTSELRVTEGRLVIELRPPVPIDKGTALRRLVEEHHLGGALYLGDDRTDVDAFRTLHDLATSGRLRRALAVGVVGAETPREVAEAADVTLPGVSAVAAFLGELAASLD